jgi:hypothetical protein
MTSISQRTVLLASVFMAAGLLPTAEGQQFSVDANGNVVANSFTGDGSGLTGVGGGRDVLDDDDMVVGQWLPTSQVLRTGPGGILYYLGASTMGFTSSFSVDVHFTGNSCTGSAFTTNTSSVTLDNLARPGILMSGVGTFSGDVYTGIQGVNVTLFTDESFINRNTGDCVDVAPDPTGISGRALSFLENVSSFVVPFRLGS